MSGKKTVELFYDVISPYSWFAFEALTRYQSKWNMALKLRPFFLGGIMKESGNQPPAMIPNKAAYMHRDLQHMASLFKVPIQEPKDFVNTVLVKGSLHAQRFVTAVQLIEPEKVEELSRQFWLRVWARDEDITQEESFHEAGKSAGLSSTIIEEALKRMKTAEVKDRLKAVTNEALEHRAFGAPLYVVTVDGKKHTFFGCDRIEALAHIIGERYEGPLVELSKL